MTVGLEEKTRRRVGALALVMVTLVSILGARLWFLQVLTGQSYAKAAESNRVRLVTTEASRGRILDRKGRVLVDNRDSYVVAIQREDLGERNVVLPRLAKLLGLSVGSINKRLADKRNSPFKPVVVAEDVALEKWITIQERPEEFPGVVTQRIPVRIYPSGNVAPHILGYVGEINEKELQRLRDKGYRLGDSIGKTGLERSYETDLRGSPGLRKHVVDAQGNLVYLLADLKPVSGKDLELSIDLEVQRVAEDALVQGILRARDRTFLETGRRFRAEGGAVVVLDVQTGEVIAMASHPKFDLSKFVGGVDPEYFKHLKDPTNDFPLLNRAMQAAYPPGSTFKPFMAAGALATGLATTGGRYPCTSEYKYADRVFRNWKARDASISLAQSLVESCDTVYYNFGARWWGRERAAERAGRKVYEAEADWARKFGMGRQVKIDLPAETAGRIPDRAWRRAFWERNRGSYCRKWRRGGDPVYEDLCKRGHIWRPGDSINASIGQGDVQVSPVQLAVAYGALANGGRVLQPRVGMKVIGDDGKPVRSIAPAVSSRIPFAPRSLPYLHEALAAVSERGTGVFPFRGWPLHRLRVASKTGSAEIAGKQPFSWFAAFAPVSSPRYAVVSVVEEAGFGSQVSGPIVRRIMDKLFDLPLTPIVYGTARSD